MLARMRRTYWVPAMTVVVLATSAVALAIRPSTSSDALARRFSALRHPPGGPEQIVEYAPGGERVSLRVGTDDDRTWACLAIRGGRNGKSFCGQAADYDRWKTLYGYDVAPTGDTFVAGLPENGVSAVRVITASADQVVPVFHNTWMLQMRGPGEQIARVTPLNARGAVIAVPARS
jgi:hypothetical protein